MKSRTPVCMFSLGRFPTTSGDVPEAQIARLRDLFREVVVEEMIDFEELRITLGAAGDTGPLSILSNEGLSGRPSPVDQADRSHHVSCLRRFLTVHLLRAVVEGVGADSIRRVI
jgi:hypothetical protein